MTDLIRDLRWAVRTLGKTPLFAAVAVLTLALGIGVNATIFTLVNSLLLRALPVERPDEMVHVYTSWPEEPFATSSYPDYLDLRDGADAFSGDQARTPPQPPKRDAARARGSKAREGITTQAYTTLRRGDRASETQEMRVDAALQPEAGEKPGLIGHASAIATLQHGGRSEVLIGEIVTGNAFQVLGVPAARGRMLLPEDDRPEASRVVVLSHGLWQRRFGRDPGVLGGTVRFNGQPYQVVGVAPESFPGLLPGVAAQYWVPTVRVGEIEPAGQINAVHGDPGATRLERRGYRWMWLKGRLAPGADPAQADAQVATVMTRLAAEHPVTNGSRTAAAKPLADVRYHPDIDRVLGPAAAVLLGAVGLVLLVVCANLASMLLARAQGRRREVAIRLALGASRGRLVRQLLAESLVVAAAGGALALLVTRWTTALLLAWKPPIPFTLSFDLDVDGRVLLFTAAVALGSAVLFGLLPARQSARGDLVADIREGARGSVGGARGWRRRLDLRSALVVAQVAITLVFLVAAALLGRGLLAARALDPGFEPERVAILGMYLEMHGYGDEEAERFFRTLRERAAALPGVTEAAVATRVPFDVNLHTSTVYPDSVEAGPDHPGFSLDVTWIDRHYFDTLGVPLLAGRNLTSGDVPDGPRVAVVNAAMARRFWGDPAAAVGRRFRVGGLDAEPHEVVGVAADTKVRSVGEEPRPLIHFARSQRPEPHGYLLAATAAGDATPLVGELRRLALEMDPELAFSETTTLAGFMGVTLYPARMGAALLAGFGLLALTLASLGLYGVIAYSVSRRRREMGIRFALGAERGTVVGMVVKSGMTLVALGIGVGVALAAAAGQLLQSLLYGQSALDPAAFAAATAVLVAVSAAANYLPARRAARTDPVTVLKEG